jgi:hypothetical protein
MTDRPDVDEQFVRERVRRASRLTHHPEARAELRRVLAELAPDLGAPVEECPACGLQGSEQALRTHDCERRGGGGSR